MPRPTRKTLVPLLLLALVVLLPPASLAGAAASAAGTIVEALPFVLGAALLPRVRVLRWLPSLGCGCGGVVPAALAVPALALTCLSFGPLIAAARSAAALLVVVGRRRTTPAPLQDGARDPLGELATLAFASGSAALLAECIGARGALLPGPAGMAISAFLGAFVGVVAPCATTGIGAAIALRAADPFAAYGLLATSGIVAFRPRLVVSLRSDARVAYASLALELALLYARGAHGIINPRFALLLPIGASLASIAALIRTPARGGTQWAAPAVVLAALVLGSPPPRETAASIPVDLYPGRAVAFTGRVARSDATSTTLVRPAILCCRADAQQLSLTLDRRLSAEPGSWLRVRGTAFVRDGRAILKLERAATVRPPQDPYLYL